MVGKLYTDDTVSSKLIWHVNISYTVQFREAQEALLNVEDDSEVGT